MPIPALLLLAGKAIGGAVASKGGKGLFKGLFNKKRRAARRLRKSNNNTMSKSGKRGGLFSIFFNPERKAARRLKRDERKSRRAGGGGFLSRIFGGRGGVPAPRTPLQAANQPSVLFPFETRRKLTPSVNVKSAGLLPASTMDWVKSNWLYLLIAALVMGLMTGYIPMPQKKKVGRKRKKMYSRASSSKSGSGRAQSVITTKAGKVIRGVDNVKAYKRRLANLKKARKK